MPTRLIRLRFWRRLQKSQQQVEGLGAQAEQHIEQHLFKRFQRLVLVRRFVFTWVGLLLLLIGGLIAQTMSLSGYYQTVKTVPGGIYTEGVLGRFTNANPLYATSDADTSVSRLIFASLFSYDRNGSLAGELASGYSVDKNGNSYTVRLKPNLTWQDGRPLTSADVLFTYQLIQNPDTQSPLQSGWAGVTVTAPDSSTLVFKLPGILASFPHNLTNGIVPKHLLEKISPANLRGADFNTIKPVGAGPFAWQAIQVTGDGNPKTIKTQIGLVPFEKYQGGEPKIQKMTVKLFASEEELIDAFASNELTAAEGLTTMPKELKGKASVNQHNLPLRAANMVFFKTTSGVLANQAVRNALVQATDVPDITKRLGYPTRAVRQPFLAGQVGYDAQLVQPGFNLKVARAALDADGWVVDKKGFRGKAGQPLLFTLSAADTAENRLVGRQLQEQWQELGVKLSVHYLSTTDFQGILTNHDYDSVLNGISIGSDPDVFVYWHSSQADIRSANRLNLSEYKNPIADAALEAGRTRQDPALRTIKYRPFLQAWQKDSPALGLYQPRLLYLTNGAVSGLEDHPLNTPAGRFDNVHNWQIREARVTN